MAVACCVSERKKIAERVFGDRSLLDWLEHLLHPLVSREYLAWREQLGQLDDPPKVCVTEVPLLFETGALEEGKPDEGEQKASDEAAD